MATRLEINFNRLLARCETMAKDKTSWDWRLEKFITALQDQLSELKKSPCRPSQETLNDYNKKVDFLKGIIEAEKLPTTAEKALATNKLATISSSGKGNSVKSKELHLHTKARYQKDMRNELLGMDDMQNGTGDRQNNPQDEEDIDSLIQHHHQMQERLADEMLMLTRNLKESVRDSGRIVKEDTKKVVETSKLADVNYNKLAVVTEQVEKHTKGCDWCMWIMLAVVIMLFLFMIMFIRLFPKKHYSYEEDL
ncbi:vesicle transport protein USE1-like [Pecten maximus]|uniref:vesicle transport protein USE1-like n=1 Tax=Pecten maximus TaxID=6579 RepID=UPI001458E509|nr:vesicle transport protein USE1-like [Pecten maximus]